MKALGFPYIPKHLTMDSFNFASLLDVKCYAVLIMRINQIAFCISVIIDIFW